MKPIASFPAETARRIVCVLTDIDDTLTTDGQLPAAAYAALENLRGAGLSVVPVTGRPAGWCDMIARFWPVDGVIGENGAFYFRHDPVARKMIRKFIATEAERAANRRRLLALGERILSEVPGAAISSDQLYREADLAIDVCEDVPPLSRAAVDKIVFLFESAGGIAKVSSIHVNGWFGRYDKLAMTRIFVRERLGLDLDEARDRIVFCGDSPNDAPMFGFFPYACGVANVHDFEGAMAATPAFIASKRGAEGFVEIADRILSARARA
ncbi:HAD hydrolase family protein [Bradyrhizobium sp. CCGUVB1N3]|uniref:HAD hydrolase family protein n=1 Tax=Bradyrhizobium sp. CCGUVB1N3 TaxID=2949629 RepID=UPI0020B402BD|nr:HAD hydrolase family protein [Bradyrhizobium sp. CCGUVB1N3]MCP3469085.1 HAD hydrolase family protein [Bradyrhizobium sp. CCGUVB1N3]